MFPEETRELPERDNPRGAKQPPDFFEASFKPTDPLHISRNGLHARHEAWVFGGRTLTEVLDRAEANWRQNYPVG